MDFLLLIKFDHLNNTYAMSFITLLFKNMPVEPKPWKGLYFVTVSMPLRIAYRQKQQVHLCFKTLRKM